MRKPKPKLPLLNRSIVSDQQALSEALSQVLERDLTQQKHSRQIRQLQQKLRRVVTQQAWHQYLLLEEASSARFIHAVDLVAGWAFRQGRRGNG